jgi:formylglycine-generating enzyme required for sulfatase activity
LIKAAPTTGPFLYDMAGNVWEWMQDWYYEDYDGVPTVGSARTAPDSTGRVVRGGSWFFDPRTLRSANRIRITTDVRGDDVGFRVGRTLTP